MLAMLLAALSPFAAAPAQAQTTVWTAALAMRPRLCAIFVALLSSLSLALPAAWAAPVFDISRDPRDASLDPVVFYTSPGETCASQPANSPVTLPEARGTGTITYSLSFGNLDTLPDGLTFDSNTRTLTATTATLTAQDPGTYFYTATDDADERTASLHFTLEVVDERAILQTLYNETDGANWTNQSGGWGDPITADCLHDLHGVNLHDGRVLWIHLQNNNLTGSIPPELSSLTSLIYLWLNNNQLSGSIPSELSSLTSLISLWLNENQLSGSIPSELSELSSLNGLKLNDNELTGEIPQELGKLTGLMDELWLQSNNLSGTIPTELGNLTKLHYLDLHGNQLSGSIPSELSSLTSLINLALHENQLSGSIPSELGSLTSLTDLILNNNQLSGSIPSELSSLTSLSRLILHDNQLSGSIPPELGSLTSLSHLWLNDNQLSGEIPDLSALIILRTLYLQGNQLSRSIPPELGSLTSLSHLWLNDNQLSGSIPPQLGSLTSLQWLDLHGNQLSGSIPPQLGSLTSLQRLYLHDNQLSESIPDLSSLTSLSHLWLNDNQLSGTLEGLNTLNPADLYLHNNQLSGEIPEFPNATDIFRLSLYGNAGLYGYPAALDDRTSLRLVAPGDGSAVCLPTTQGGSDCTVPTLVDNLQVEASGSDLVFSWAPNPADSGSGGYKTRHFLPAGNTFTLKRNSPTTGTITIPNTVVSFLVRTTNTSTSPELYWLSEFSPTTGGDPPPPRLRPRPPSPPRGGGPPPEEPSGPAPPSIESAEGVLHSEDAEDGFSLTPAGEGGNIVYGERTINVSVTRDECLPSANPAVIVSRNILDRVTEITFELSEDSPQDPPSGFRLEGCAAEIDFEGAELEEGETVTVCLPSVEGEGHIRHYDEESGEWEPLSTVSRTVNGEEMLCAETDALSLFGVFVIEETVPSSGSGCAVAAADGEAGTTGRWEEKAAFNLLLVMSVLLLVPGGSLCRWPDAGKAPPSGEGGQSGGRKQSDRA